MQQLGDLHRVERGALEQVVAHHEEVEAVVVVEVARARARRRPRRAPPTPAASGCRRARGSGRRAAPPSPRRGRRGARTSRAPRSAWPTITGTRTQVGATSRPGMLEDLARLVAGASSPRRCSRPRPRVPSHGTTLKASVLAWTLGSTDAAAAAPSLTRSCSRTRSTWPWSSSMPFWPAPPAAWKEVQTIARQAEGVVQRLGRQHDRHRRAVRVGDDALADVRRARRG